MPLEHFRILHWATEHFGAMPPMIMGGVGVAVLLAGAFLAVMGFKMHPTSWGLLGAGLGCIVLTYFIVGAAIAGLSSSLAGGEQVASAAPRVVPWAAAMVPLGLGMFGLRKALQSWSSEESSGKAAGALVGLASLAAIFVAVQIARGTVGPGAPDAAHAPVVDEDPPSSPDDSNLRRRGVGGAPRH